MFRRQVHRDNNGRVCPREEAAWPAPMRCGDGDIFERFHALIFLFWLWCCYFLGVSLRTEREDRRSRECGHGPRKKYTPSPKTTRRFSTRGRKTRLLVHWLSRRLLRAHGGLIRPSPGQTQCELLYVCTFVSSRLFVSAWSG